VYFAFGKHKKGQFRVFRFWKTYKNCTQKLQTPSVGFPRHQKENERYVPRAPSLQRSCGELIVVQRAVSSIHSGDAEVAKACEPYIMLQHHVEGSRCQPPSRSGCMLCRSCQELGTPKRLLHAPVPTRLDYATKPREPCAITHQKRKTRSSSPRDRSYANYRTCTKQNLY